MSWHGPGQPDWQHFKLYVLQVNMAGYKPYFMVIGTEGAAGEWMVAEHLDDCWAGAAEEYPGEPKAPGIWVLEGEGAEWDAWNAGGSPMEPGCTLRKAGDEDPDIGARLSWRRATVTEVNNLLYLEAR